LQCVYAREVWFRVRNWAGQHILTPDTDATDVEQWWISTLASLPNNQRRSTAAILMYTTWNIWKERNRRAFEDKLLRADQVFKLILEDINLRRQAGGSPTVG
ncbi:hypothetical protein BAE44_0005243, partial [Dichanthelium oligosanthes]